MSVKYFGSDALNKLIDLVKTALGLKADDSNVVHKTGAETVAGEKSFTDRATFSKLNNDTPIYVKGNDNGACIGFTDSSDSMCGYLGVKNDNKPYFFNQGAKRLALLSETVEKIEDSDNCIKWVSGNGSYDYCLLATINILGGYADFPIVFKIFARGYAYTTLQIKFKSVNNVDPDLDSFTYDNSNNFRLYKSGTGTWQLYGIYSSGKWGHYGIDRVIKGFSNVIDVTVNGTNVSSIPSGAVAPSNNGSQIHTLTTNWLTLENYTWTRSSGGAYYISGGIDIGLSSSDTIISIMMVDFSVVSGSYNIHPYRSSATKIGLMSNTDSFSDNSSLKFIVAYV